jgi:nucleotide-binding universal stress UspA family protein
VHASLPEDAALASAEVFVRQGGVERVILSEARRWGADLLFAGALASNPRFAGVLGSVARRLARHADRSLYLSLHRDLADPVLRTLVVSTEFDAESDAAARAAVDLGHSAAASVIHFVHEYDPRARGAIESVLRGSEQARYEQMMTGTQRFQLANAVEGLDLRGLEPRLACLEGKELTATTEYARTIGADLLVMAAPHHRLGLLDRFFGDPTETVLQRFPCSVLLVRAAAERREG